MLQRSTMRKKLEDGSLLLVTDHLYQDKVVLSVTETFGESRAVAYLTPKEAVAVAKELLKYEEDID